MTPGDPPALHAFIAQLGEACLIAEVFVRRSGTGYELRHRSDKDRLPDQLRARSVSDLRALAQTTAAGAFRPLRSAPNLASGWWVSVKDHQELGLALDHLYPGALTDWYAARQPEPPLTHFREFTRRQTGMYRITTMLSDEQAASVVRACCPARFCLKRRLWTVGAEPADDVAGKSLIPCLEPCALFLEFARKIARIEQEERIPVTSTRSQLETVSAALELAMGEPARSTGSGQAPEPREADFSAPTNPRRAAWVHDRVRTPAQEGLTGNERD